MIAVVADLTALELAVAAHDAGHTSFAFVAAREVGFERASSRAAVTRLAIAVIAGFALLLHPIAARGSRVALEFVLFTSPISARILGVGRRGRGDDLLRRCVDAGVGQGRSFRIAEGRVVSFYQW